MRRIERGRGRWVVRRAPGGGGRGGCGTGIGGWGVGGGR